LRGPPRKEWGRQRRFALDSKLSADVLPLSCLPPSDLHSSRFAQFVHACLWRYGSLGQLGSCILGDRHAGWSRRWSSSRLSCSVASKREMKCSRLGALHTPASLYLFIHSPQYQIWQYMQSTRREREKNQRSLQGDRKAAKSRGSCRARGDERCGREAENSGRMEWMIYCFPCNRLWQHLYVHGSKDGTESRERQAPSFATIREERGCGFKSLFLMQMQS